MTMTDHMTAIGEGVAAWSRLRRPSAVTWDDWILVGEALAIGRAEVMRDTGSTRPIGSRYNKAFSEWLLAHGLRDLDQAARAKLFIMMANLPAIQAWRDQLPECERKKLNHPASILRHYPGVA